MITFLAFIAVFAAGYLSGYSYKSYRTKMGILGDFRQKRRIALRRAARSYLR